jgi:predicted aspartyl protease
MAKVSRYSMRTRIPTAILLTLLQGIVQQALAADHLQANAPVRLALTFVRANPVTTITVGDQPVQAIVDTGGDGAVTLTQAVIDRVGAVSLSDTLVTKNSYGQRLKKPRFRVPVLTIGGQTFKNMAVVQAPNWPAGQSPPVPSGIGRQFLSRYFVVLDFPHRSITLYTEASITARPVFEAMGFRIIVPQTVTVQGESMTNYRMEKRLEPAAMTSRSA